jgi:four helix bundle protein
MQLLKETYERTERFPRREIYGITAQMRRAALSIPSNISEGHGRPTTRDFVRFLGIASGSLRELQTFCDASVMLGFISEAELTKMRHLGNESGRMLVGLRDSLRRRMAPKSPAR